jgi:ADP-ribosyl-[dinitrogen reductase] hydrolase
MILIVLRPAERPRSARQCGQRREALAVGPGTDTNGAIAGALLGAVYGRAAVPQQWMNRILTCQPLAGIPGVARPRPAAFWPVDALWLAERLLFLGQAA